MCSLKYDTLFQWFEVWKKYQLLSFLLGIHVEQLCCLSVKKLFVYPGFNFFVKWCGEHTHLFVDIMVYEVCTHYIQCLSFRLHWSTRLHSWVCVCVHVCFFTKVFVHSRLLVGGIKFFGLWEPHALLGTGLLETLVAGHVETFLLHNLKGFPVCCILGMKTE